MARVSSGQVGVSVERGSQCRELACDLRGWAGEHLVAYKVPREVVFVDELPRTATGKVRKRELRTAA